jgi:hypothetical protein
LVAKEICGRHRTVVEKGMMVWWGEEQPSSASPGSGRPAPPPPPSTRVEEIERCERRWIGVGIKRAAGLALRRARAGRGRQAPVRATTWEIEESRACGAGRVGLVLWVR